MCDVCLEDDDDEDNEILICELCLAATHQKCYGSDLLDGIPEGDWFCIRCTTLKKDPSRPCTDIKCILCPKIEGILKPIRKDLKLWVHPICVYWLTGV